MLLQHFFQSHVKSSLIFSYPGFLVFETNLTPDDHLDSGAWAPDGDKLSGKSLQDLNLHSGSGKDLDEITASSRGHFNSGFLGDPKFQELLAANEPQFVSQNFGNDKASGNLQLSENLAGLDLTTELGARAWLLKFSAGALQQIKEQGDNKTLAEAALDFTKLFVYLDAVDAYRFGFKTTAYASSDQTVRGNLTLGAHLPLGLKTEVTYQYLRKLIENDFGDDVGKVKDKFAQHSAVLSLVKKLPGLLKEFGLETGYHTVQGKVYDKGTKIEETPDSIKKSQTLVGFGDTSVWDNTLKATFGKNMDSDGLIQKWEIEAKGGLRQVTHGALLDLPEAKETGKLFALKGILTTGFGKITAEGEMSDSTQKLRASVGGDHISAYGEKIEYKDSDQGETRFGVDVNVTLPVKGKFELGKLVKPWKWFASKANTKPVESTDGYVNASEMEHLKESNYFEAAMRTHKLTKRDIEVIKGLLDQGVSVDLTKNVMVVDALPDFVGIQDVKSSVNIGEALSLTNGNLEIDLNKMPKISQEITITLLQADGKLAEVKIVTEKGSLIVKSVTVETDLTNGDTPTTPTQETDNSASWNGGTSIIPALAEGGTYQVILPTIQDKDGVEASAYKLYLDGTEVQFNKTNWVYDLPKNLTKGNHTLTFEGKGVDGGEGENSTPAQWSRTFEVTEKVMDATANWDGDLPTIPDLEEGDTYKITLPKIQDADGEDTSAYKLYLDGTEIQFDKTKWEYDLPTDLTTGEHTLTFEGKGVDGGEGANSTPSALMKKFTIKEKATVEQDAPAGWSGSLTELTLQAGEARTINIPQLQDADGVQELHFMIDGYGELTITNNQVTLPTNLPAGTYTMRLSGVGKDGGEGNNSTPSVLTSKLTVTQATTEVQDAPASWSGALGNVTMQTGEARTISVPQVIDTNGVQEYEFFVDGTKLNIVNGQVTLPTNLSAGTYTLRLSGQGKDGGAGDNSNLNILTATLTVTQAQEEPTNTAPDAINDSGYTTPYGTAITLDVLGNDTDADGNSLSITGIENQVGGVFQVVNGKILFTPSVGFSGTASCQYGVSDGQGGTDMATATVAVGAKPNTNPDAVNDSGYTTPYGTAITLDVLGNDTDADGNSLSITGIENQGGGVFQVVNGKILFTPSAGFSGTASCQYGVSDGQGGTDMATLTVTVSVQANATPEIIEDGRTLATITAGETAIIPISALVTDADGDALTFNGAFISENGQHASVSFNGTSLIVTTDIFCNGTVGIVYEVTDGKANGNNAGSVNINVNPYVAPPPVTPPVVVPPTGC